MALVIAAIAIAVVSAAASYSMSVSAQKEAEKAAQEAMGVLLNRVGLTEQIPVVYGTRRVGGVRVFASTGEGASSDLPNDELYMALVVSEGEVESITDLYVDGEAYAGSKYVNWLSWWAYTGSDSQAASSFLISNSDGKWTSDHKLSGLAYIVVKLRMTEIQRKNVWQGIPELTVLVKGQKVYDPRTSTTAWSDNPALCIRDYLTNTRYGKGIPTSDIDDTLFSAAATELEQSYTLVTGEPADRPYRCNAVLNADEKLLDNIGDMLLGCKAFLPYSNGQYGLVLDNARASSFDFNTDNIIGGIKVGGVDKGSKYNQVVVTFPNALSDYQSDEVVYPEVDSAEDIAWLAEDNGERLKKEIGLQTITSRSAAYNTARTILVRSRKNTKVSFVATSDALNLVIGDVCQVTYASLGWVNKKFKIEELTLNNDGTCSVAAREYDASAYQIGEIATDPSYPSAALPDPFEVRAPTNLQVSESSTIANDGTLVSALAVEWVESTDGFVSGYELQWKKTTDLEYNSVSIISNKYLITGVETGANYDIRVRAINGFGSSSDFLGGTSGGLVGDLTAPSAPTSVVATAGLGEITLTWVKPTDFDYSHCQVYENTTDNFGTATLVANASQDFFTRSGLDYDQTRYYWLKSVDFSGNASTQTNSVNATTLFVDSDAFANGIYSLFTEQGLYAIEDVTSLPLAGDFTGQKVFNRTDGKLYQWTGSAWELVVAQVNAPDINGQLVTAQIAVNAVTNALIANNAVQEENIANLAITAAKVADSAITTAKIANAAVEAGKIATSAVTGAKIATSAITETKIASDAVTTPKIAAGAVTAGEIAAGAIVAGKISSGAVTAGTIAAGAVTAGTIAANAVTAGTIAANAVTATKIAADSITTAKIAAGAVTATEIAADSITTSKIAAGAVTATEIASNSITSAKIAAGTIQANDIATGTITATQIAGNTITGNKIVANTITGGLLATAGIITNSAQINNLVVTGAKIANAAVDTLQLAGQAVTIPRLVEVTTTTTVPSSSSSWVNIASITFTPSAANLPLRFICAADPSITFYTAASSTNQMRMRLMRGAVQIGRELTIGESRYSYDDAYPTSSKYEQSGDFTLVDTNATASSQTWTLQARATNLNASASSVTYATISVVETKR